MIDYDTLDFPISMEIFVDEILKRESREYPFVIWEIGSRDGKDARRLKKLLPNSDVHAFEPSPEEYEIYKNFNKDIHWTGVAIYNNPVGVNKVTLNRKDFGSGIHSIRDRGNYGDRQDTIEVPTIRADQYMAMLGLKAVDIVKIDAEGCSYEVLDSFGSYLDAIRFLHVETERVEYFQGQKLEEEVFQLLRNHGFEMTLTNRIIGLEQSDSVWIKV